MKLFSKKRRLELPIILCCYFLCVFIAGCLYNYDENAPGTKYFYYIENNIRYYCNKEKKEAYLHKLFVERKDEEKNDTEYDFDENAQTVVIPETIKSGEYRVVGMRGQESYYTVMYELSSLAPSSWKNIRKIYLPYTMDKIFFENTFKAKDGAYYDDRLRVMIPSVESFSYTRVEKCYFSATKYTFDSYGKCIIATVPQKHYDMVVEQFDILGDRPVKTVEEYVQNLVTPNYVFTFNYEGAPNEGIYWIDLIVDENTPYVLPTVPTREGYTFGGWYMEEDCITEWDNQMTPTTEVKTMYAKWIVNETVE